MLTAHKKTRRTQLLTPAQRAMAHDISSRVSAGIAIKQDVHALLRTVQREYGTAFPNISADDYNALARRFLSDGHSYDQVRAITGASASSIIRALRDTYAIDTRYVAGSREVPYTWASKRKARAVSSRLQGLLDWNERLVAETFPAETLLQGPPIDALADLFNNLIIGAGMANALVTNHAFAITPHLAYTIDWFMGPQLVDAPPRVRINASLLDPGDAVQYVVREHADQSLDAMFGGSREGLSFETEPVRITLRSVRSLLFQALFSLEAAYEVAGFVHGKFQLENLFVRYLQQEPASPYRGQAWSYTRGAGTTGKAARHRHFQLAPSEHMDLFAEVTDFARSRAYCSAEAPPRRGPLQLFGNPGYRKMGVSLSPMDMDRSHDMRNMGIELLAHCNVDAMELGGAAVSTDEETRRVRDDLKHLIGVMCNIVYLAKVVADMCRPLTMSVAVTMVHKIDFLLGLYTKAAAGAPIHPDAIPKRDACINLYNVMAPFFLQQGASPEIGAMVGTIRMESVITSGTGSSARTTTRSKTLNASVCLDLPIFKAYAITEPSPNAIQVALVQLEDTLLDPQWGLPRPSHAAAGDDTDADDDPMDYEITVAPSKQQQKKRPLDTADEPDEETPRALKRQRKVYARRLAQRLALQTCFVCGHAATGKTIHEDSKISQEAYCSTMCAQAHWNTIVSDAADAQ